MRRTAFILAALMLPLSGFAGDTVTVSSLQVKERIQSIEQINVTAEKQQADIAPDSQRVADILRELEEDTVDVEKTTTDEPQSD